MEEEKTSTFTLSVNKKSFYKILKSDLLIDGEPFYILSPKLITVLRHVGYERRNSSLMAEALILQQIHIETDKIGISYNNYKWLIGDINEWLKERFGNIKYFDFKGALKELIKQKFIRVIYRDNKTLFRINYRRFFSNYFKKKAQEKMEQKIKQLREYPEGKYPLNTEEKKKLRQIEKKLVKRKTRAVFFRLS